MDRLPGSGVEQTNIDWIHTYPFTMDSASDPSGLNSAQIWRPALGLSTYDFGFDDSMAAGRKFPAVPAAFAHSTVNHVSPSPSLFPSVSSVQSSPHTSPTSVDPSMRADHREHSGRYASAPPPQLSDSRRGQSGPLKRSRDDFEQQQPPPPPPPQQQQHQPPRNVKLDEENRYLVYLRDQQRLPWKEISRKFEQTFQRPYQAPALQMRYGRLKNRLHPWTEADSNALQMAQEYYVNKRFEIIAEKMLEFGATDVWAPRLCARKLRQLEKDGNAGPASPAMSNSSSEEAQKSYGVRVGDVTLRSTSPQLPGTSNWVPS